MTKEEIKQICQIYDNLREERNAATIAYNSDDVFWEHVLATYKLSHSSLSSDIDEAAFEYENTLWEEGYKDCGYSPQEVLDAFKAGAEWERQMKQEQPEVDLEMEIDAYTTEQYHKIFDGTGTPDEFDWEDIASVIEDVARHFYELGLKARKEE